MKGKTLLSLAQAFNAMLPCTTFKSGKVVEKLYVALFHGKSCF
jgi:hypothetical protein